MNKGLRGMLNRRNLAALLITLALPAACADVSGPPENREILCTIRTRSMWTLGFAPDSCSILVCSPEDTLEFGVTVLSQITEALLTGLEESNPTLTVSLFQGDSLLALREFRAEAGFPGEADVRARWENRSDAFLLDAAPGGVPPADQPVSVLFVGNSYTAANGGLDSILTMLVRSAHPGTVTRYGSITAGGYTLENHWNDPATIGAIAGGWDLVVFQEQSTRPVSDPELMYDYAGLLALWTEACGGRPGYFMTWARKNDPSMADPLASAYFHAGAVTDGMVCPVGLAWETVRETDPDMELYDPDGSHPSTRGTYLTACVMYGAMTGESPAGILWTNDPTITPEERLFLQETAWAAVETHGPEDWRRF